MKFMHALALYSCVVTLLIIIMARVFHSLHSLRSFVHAFNVTASEGDNGVENMKRKQSEETTIISSS